MGFTPFSWLCWAMKLYHHNAGGVLWVRTPRPANHCGLKVGEHSPDSSRMTEDGVQRGERRGSNGNLQVSTPPGFVQDGVTYQFHGSGGRNRGDETSRNADWEVAQEVKQATCTEEDQLHGGRRELGSMGRWEEVLLISVVFPSYCHFLCSWSRVERERKTQRRRSEI